MTNPHADEWLSSLRAAMSDVERLRASGPAL